MSLATAIAKPPALAVYRYDVPDSAADKTAAGEPLVLLHGWGSDSRTWAPLLPDLQRLGPVLAVDLPGFGQSAPQDDCSLDTLLAQLLDCLPQRATLVGWSLGGMLALALAQRCPSRVSRVITLAANLRFVADAQWPQAMAPSVERRFVKGFAAEPQATHKRFVGLLAQGDIDERRLLRQLRREATPDIDNVSGVNDNWLSLLQLLRNLDNRSAFAGLRQPGLHLYGQSDALVPEAAAAEIARVNPTQQVKVLAGAAHALHWSQPQQVLAAVTAFLAPRPDKRQVARSFSRAADTYNSAAHLQRAVGERLLSKLPLGLSPTAAPQPNSPRVLDLGCGTGAFSDALALRLPGAEILGLDIAEGMVHFARRQSTAPTHWLCADAETLPLADASVYLIYSNLAIQWCDTAALCRELHRVLRPGGRALLSTLGPDTLCELRQAWQQVDSYTHVNRFESADQVRGALAAAGLALDDWQEEKRVLEYHQLQHLTRELKALGAHNSNAGRPAGLTGRASLRAFLRAYEQQRQDNGLLPASYQVIYLQVHRPESGE